MSAIYCSLPQHSTRATSCGNKTFPLRHDSENSHDINPIENICNDPKDMLSKDMPENVMTGSLLGFRPLGRNPIVFIVFLIIIQHFFVAPPQHSHNDVSIGYHSESSSIFRI
jgi:hypothetical protein